MEINYNLCLYWTFQYEFYFYNDALVNLVFYYSIDSILSNHVKNTTKKNTLNIFSCFFLMPS